MTQLRTGDLTNCRGCGIHMEIWALSPQAKPYCVPCTYPDCKHCGENFWQHEYNEYVDAPQCIYNSTTFEARQE